MIRTFTALLLLAAAAHAAPVMVVDSQSEYWLPLDANGWTVLPENTDPSAVTIYVSSSEGSNENDGLSAETPVATIAYARSLCRNGNTFWDQPGYTSYANYVNGIDTVADTITWYSDWILLKCGDTWAENLPITCGESAENPFVYASYGTGDRPVVENISKAANNAHVYGSWAVIGIEFTGYVQVFNSQYEEFGWDKASNILMEDCLVRNGVTFAVADHVSIRRSIIVDAYSTDGSYKQGLYAIDANSMLVEECVFDHNGWHDTIENAEPSAYKRNIYIASNCYGLAIRNSVIARSSSEGAQMRTGGDCINNLFLENPSALNWGYVNGSSITPGGVTGEITDNVVMGDANICRPRPSCEDNPRGAGFTIANVISGVCSGNVITTRITDPSGNIAFTLDADLSDNSISNIAEAGNIGINNFTLSENVVYAWDGGLRTNSGTYVNVIISNNDIQDGTATNYVGRDYSSGATFSGNRYYAGGLANAWQVDGGATDWPAWVAATGETGSNEQVSYTAPTRSIATYMASLGYSAGDQTTEKFLELARANSKADWDTDFTADAVNTYIRAGFEE